jgi:hypothetical protein
VSPNLLTCEVLPGAYFGAAASCCMLKALNVAVILGVACHMSVWHAAYYPMTCHTVAWGGFYVFGMSTRVCVVVWEVVMCA